MSNKTDEIILKHYLGRLANMIYNIRKCWMPNDNMDKAIPHLEKACRLVKAELKAVQERIKKGEK